MLDKSEARRLRSIVQTMNESNDKLTKLYEEQKRDIDFHEKGNATQEQSLKELLGNEFSSGYYNVVAVLLRALQGANEEELETYRRCLNPPQRVDG